MQFKNIVASIAAFAVAGVVATPVDVLARAEQAPSKQQVIDSANAYLKEHAQDKVTAADVALANHAAEIYGECWCGCPDNIKYPPLVVGETCPPVQRWYIGAAINWFDEHELWDGAFTKTECSGLLNIASCNDGPGIGINILNGIL